ncbi:hypothetical protein AB0C13_25430 [Streptomyces sp. NPDC049099]|uniref:hypothetical protein n=1 Tax=Streptomyces sp. NPDC049099 TaxID=3155768 RepID=UPI00342D88C1
MNCARCTEEIGRDEPTKEIQNHGASAAGGSVIVHARLCPRAPQQTAPTRR